MKVQAVTRVIRKLSHLDLALTTDIPSKESDRLRAREGSDISQVKRGQECFQQSAAAHTKFWKLEGAMSEDSSVFGGLLLQATGNQYGRRP
jgi:Ni2+-binding GTPase involved in maturation of urease and hydrogenase